MSVRVAYIAALRLPTAYMRDVIREVTKTVRRRRCEATPGHIAILIPSYMGRDGAPILTRASASVSPYPLILPQPSSVAAFGNSAQTLLDFGSHVLTELLLFHFSRRTRFHDQ